MILEFSWMYFVDRCSTEAPNIYVMPDGHAVARSSDFIVFSVEAEFIEKVVAEYGPCTYSLLLTLLSTRKF